MDYGKKRGCSREEREKERLKHKYKKEFKGALRELRKDSRFLAREKLNEVIQRCDKRANITAKTTKWKLLTFVLSVFQRHGEEEEGEGTVWQSGLSGGGVEGPEEEEEKVNVHISTHLSITCSLLKRPEEKSASHLEHLELNSSFFYSKSCNKLTFLVYNHGSIHHGLTLSSCSSNNGASSSVIKLAVLLPGKRSQI